MKATTVKRKQKAKTQMGSNIIRIKLACKKLKTKLHSKISSIPSADEICSSTNEIGYDQRKMEVNCHLIETSKNSLKQKRDKQKIMRYEKWTKKEHAKLMEALELYGNAWSLVQKHLGTRTREQIRSHVQKYFLRVKKEKIKEDRKSVV